MASTSAITLDDLASSSPASLESHLFFPTHDDKDPVKERSKSPAEPQSRHVLKDRLYIGNLHPTVDEYTLLQVFSKFGKVTKLDYLFHKTGPSKGKPRGYAFVEYGNSDDALKALTIAHDKPLRGRKLVVTFAHQAPLDQYGGVGIPSSLKSRKTMMDTGRPTALSMIKTGLSNRTEGRTEDKIAMMEAKLRQLENSDPNATSTGRPSTDASGSGATSTLPHHHTLPSKPPPPLPSHLASQPSSRSTTPITRPKTPLPALPLLPPSSLQGQLPGSGSLLGAKSLQKSISMPVASSTVHTPQPRPAKSKLAGVKIKPKPKTQAGQQDDINISGV